MSKVFTGVRAVFKINGKQVTYASSVNYTINHALQPIETLDSLPARELAEVGYSVSFSCNSFRIAGLSPISQGFMPTLEKILTQPELTVELVDKMANNGQGQTVMRIVGVKMQERGGSVDARGVSTEAWSFLGLRASDEAGN